MEGKICQSCAMPLTSDDMFGTNADGSVNEDYCKWCYDKGAFLEDCTMDEYIERCEELLAKYNLMINNVFTQTFLFNLQYTIDR